MHYDILLVLLLIIFNGFFTLSEMALVLARKTRLKLKADEGDASASRALDLTKSSNRFLSTAQIGATLTVILTGALGEVALADRLASYLEGIPSVAPYSSSLSLTLIVLGTTYLTLVLGELVPKRLSLNNPERIALMVAGPMSTLSSLAFPIVMILSASTNLVLKVLRVKPSKEPPVTAEEIRILIDLGTRAGVFEEAEQDLVEGVFRLGERGAISIMTPRADVVWLDINDPPDIMLRKVEEADYFLYPVIDGSVDDILGMVRARDLLFCTVKEMSFDLRSRLIEPVFVPESMDALKILKLFKESGSYSALVVDEFGSVLGMVTLRDIMEEIVGDLPNIHEPQEPDIVKRQDGSWLVDGSVSVDEFKDVFRVKKLPEEDNGYYQTIGGFVMMYLERIPSPGDSFEWNGFRFEVVDMDDRRVDKLVVTLRPYSLPPKSCLKKS
jgi:putative hemolysin